MANLIMVLSIGLISPIHRTCPKNDLRPFVLNLTWAFARAFLAFFLDFPHEFLGTVAACHVASGLGSRIDSCSSHGTKKILYSSEKPMNDKNTTYAQYQSNKTCYARVCDKNEVDKPLYLHYRELIKRNMDFGFVTYHGGLLGHLVLQLHLGGF